MYIYTLALRRMSVNSLKRILRADNIRATPTRFLPLFFRGSDFRVVIRGAAAEVERKITWGFIYGLCGYRVDQSKNWLLRVCIWEGRAFILFLLV